MGLALGTRRLISQEDAARIQTAQTPRSKFIGTWSRKTTFDAGYLVPFLVDEVLPGDHMKYRATAYVRMSTPIFPIMDNQRIDTFFFFVPNRILWENWQKFMGEQGNPGDSIDYTIPTVAIGAGGAAIGSIYDHMGLPNYAHLNANNYYVNALPFRAYDRIYNDWFRDQNVQNGVSTGVGDGPDLTSYYELRRRNKSHDYFTSALPWPQKFTAPNVPLLGAAPVHGIGVTNVAYTGTGNYWETGKNALTNYAYATAASQAGAVAVQRTGPLAGSPPNIYADLSAATGVSINQLREAFLVQELLERDARGGSRYVEIIKSHFGVTSPDFRLQRPEYIGGGQSPLVVTPVAQTAPSTGQPVGWLGGAGTGVGQHEASYAATEHGFIIGLINVRTELSYRQGVHRMWTRETRLDYYWPSLAQLGEQAILRREIYATGSAGNDEAVFGYQERYHEYRTRYSEVTGYFRSNIAGTLDAWHLAQNFSAAPTLNPAFLQEDPPMARVLAAGSTANGLQYLADIEIHREATRPLPVFGTPVTLGRF